MKNTLNKLRNYFPLSLRGLIVSGLIYFCLISLGGSRSDLVAAVIGALLLISLLTFLCIIIPSFFLIKQRLKLENLSIEDKYISNIDNEVVISLKNFNIPPLFLLEIHRVFQKLEGSPKDSPILTKSLSCTGSFLNGQNVTNLITFPHRGHFNQDHYKLILSDYFGLTKITWNLVSPLAYAVYPQNRSIEPLPVLLASSVSGDLTSSTDIRSGDLFDTKQYQAGDSLKRILWKVYARSEELIVRHPEAAIIPEGELVAYTIALSEHDFVVSATLSYLKLIHDQNISFLAGFFGDSGSVATSISSTEEHCLNYAIRPTIEDAIKEFETFFYCLTSNNHQPVEIILFAPEVQNGDLKRYYLTRQITNAIQSHATSLGLRVHLALVPEPEQMQSEDTNNIIQFRKKNIKPVLYNSDFNNDTHKVKFL